MVIGLCKTVFLGSSPNSVDVERFCKRPWETPHQLYSIVDLQGTEDLLISMQKGIKMM